MNWALFFALVRVANAFNLFSWPFIAPSTYPALVSSPEHSHDPHKTVAIIGAGAGGSSAAFFIHKAKERYDLDIDVHVYEKNDYVGGRSITAFPYDDPAIAQMELGASVFVKSNKNLWRASDEFNLSRMDVEDDDDVIAVWDGEKFVTTFSNGWWHKLKSIWRYGYFSLKQIDEHAKTLLSTFISVYTRETPAWKSIEHLASILNFTDMVSQPASGYFKSHGISDNAIYEIIDPATRVNYGQNADKINAMEGSISLAAAGASGVIGGNWQIFDRFLNASGATLFSNTPVKSIKWNGSTDTWTIKGPNGSLDYKAIILAAPYHFTGISIPDSLSSQIPQLPYIRLHVTLLSTTALHANPVYFGLKPTDTVPPMILTTSKGAKNGGKEPEFNSMTYHGAIQHANQTEHLFKIFSKRIISDEWLSNVFSNQVGWVLRKEWDAYPELPPTTTFPPVKLDKGFFYVNAIETFISTMETSTLAARNVVDLLLQEEFGSGLCLKAPGPLNTEQVVMQPTSDKVPSEVAEEDFVLGWDC